ncbi:hypothetical protein BDV96DRAFT_626810 [Lophiotrema nucula]|uniref:Uncharacterized protein n=1 Tax=Lophiotrema nucula TaxID=690887 RepID=A0A6A5ZW91_9PLEO|nr:hypothetical protein BDV96DRAFT_626810 [Lophiotrema nucula]
MTNIIMQCLTDTRQLNTKGQIYHLTDNEVNYIYSLIGVKDHHTMCPSCWEVQGLAHRCNWLRCTNACPACPANAQHSGQVFSFLKAFDAYELTKLQVCPHLTSRNDTSWFMEHMGYPKNTKAISPPPSSPHNQILSPDARIVELPCGRFGYEGTLCKGCPFNSWEEYVKAGVEIFFERFENKGECFRWDWMLKER